MSEVIFNCPRETYERMPGVNFSTLKHLVKSPAHYRHALTARTLDTDPMILGRATHLATLEPERFRNEVALWEGGTRRGKVWDAFRAENVGREILKPPAYNACLTLQAAVRNNPDAAKYLAGGQGEITVLWKHVAVAVGAVPAFEMDCKARLDFRADCGALVDLKTARCVSPEEFARACFNLRYHMQAAYYVDGYLAATGKRLPYVVVAVETAPPYVVQVYRIPDAVLDVGRQEYRTLLERLHYCRTNSIWGPYFDGEAELELPRWATHSVSDEDVTGLDLIIGHQESGDGL